MSIYNLSERNDLTEYLLQLIKNVQLFFLFLHFVQEFSLDILYMLQNIFLCKS